MSLHQWSPNPDRKSSKRFWLRFALLMSVILAVLIIVAVIS
jgi:hypothetical protein